MRNNGCGHVLQQSNKFCSYANFTNNNSTSRARNEFSYLHSVVSVVFHDIFKYTYPTFRTLFDIVEMHDSQNSTLKYKKHREIRKIKDHQIRQRNNFINEHT